MPCRAVPVGPCHHRASCQGYGPRHGPKARRATRPRSCQASSRPIFSSFFRISRVYFLTGHSGWMDGPTNLYFLFFLELKAIFFIGPLSIGPCLSRATGQVGGPGTARCLGPCPGRAKMPGRGPSHGLHSQLYSSHRNLQHMNKTLNINKK